jgi:hypothetical protein
VPFTERELESTIESLEGRFDPTTLDDVFAARFAHLSNLAEEWWRASRQHFTPGWEGRDLEIVFVRSMRVSAMATKTAEADYVLISRGAIASIYGTMSGLMSTPSFMPSVGVASAEVSPNVPLTNGFPPMPLLTKEHDETTVSFYHPSDPARGAFGTMLADNALHFLLWHELGHILAGHLEWMEKLGLAALVSIADTDGGMPDRHVLECDADCFAAHVESYLNCHPSVQPSWKDTFQWSVDPTDAGLIAYATAVSALFRLIDSGGLAPTAPKGSHPHPAVRSNIAASFAYSLAMVAGQLVPGDLPRIVTGSVGLVEQTWAHLGLPGQRTGDPSTWAKEVARMSNELVKRYDQLKPGLRKFARVPARWHSSWPT